MVSEQITQIPIDLRFRPGHGSAPAFKTPLGFLKVFGSSLVLVQAAAHGKALLNNSPQGNWPKDIAVRVWFSLPLPEAADRIHQLILNNQPVAVQGLTPHGIEGLSVDMVPLKEVEQEDPLQRIKALPDGAGEMVIEDLFV